VSRLLVGAVVAVALVALVGRGAHRVRLAFNPSPSAPRGWYWVTPTDYPDVGDFVLARLPRDVASFAADRGYLPASVPVLKQVMATAGHEACIRDGSVLIDGTARARALGADARGRSMPVWRHCRKLLPGELFLLNASSSASFDSRCFGPLDRSFVIGKALPLWTFASP